MSFLSAAATSRWKLSRKDLRLRRGSVSVVSIVVSRVVSIERMDDYKFVVLQAHTGVSGYCFCP